MNGALYTIGPYIYHIPIYPIYIYMAIMSILYIILFITYLINSKAPIHKAYKHEETIPFMLSQKQQKELKINSLTVASIVNPCVL